MCWLSGWKRCFLFFILLSIAAMVSAIGTPNISNGMVSDIVMAVFRTPMIVRVARI